MIRVGSRPDGAGPPPLSPSERLGVPPPAGPEPEPVMEMHGIPDDSIQGWVEAAGGRVLTSFDWDEVSGSPSRDWQRRGYVSACGR